MNYNGQKLQHIKSLTNRLNKKACLGIVKPTTNIIDFIFKQQTTASRMGKRIMDVAFLPHHQKGEEQTGQSKLFWGFLNYNDDDKFCGNFELIKDNANANGTATHNNEVATTSNPTTIETEKATIAHQKELVFLQIRLAKLQTQKIYSHNKLLILLLVPCFFPSSCAFLRLHLGSAIVNDERKTQQYHHIVLFSLHPNHVLAC